MPIQELPLDEGVPKFEPRPRTKQPHNPISRLLSQSSTLAKSQVLQ